MATSKRFIIFFMLALQLLCSVLLAHALPTSEDSFSGPDGTVIPHQFLAWEDYSLGSHWQRIGSELNITRYYKNIGCYYIDFSYISTDDLSEDSTLALIRSDPNVESVSPNMQFRMEMAVIQNVTSGTRDQNEAQIAHVLNSTSMSWREG